MNARDGYIKLRLIVTKSKPGKARQRVNREAHGLWQRLSPTQRISAMEELLSKLKKRVEKEKEP